MGIEYIQSKSRLDYMSSQNRDTSLRTSQADEVPAVARFQRPEIAGNSGEELPPDVPI